MSRGDLSPLRDILDREAGSGRTLDLWWRDDDATRHTPALDRLLGLAEATGCPVAIAAIPTRIETSLRARLAGERAVALLVHGLTHANHAAPGEKPAEFGAGRPAEAALADLRRAADLVPTALGLEAVPIFVPPWNRIAPDIAASLPGLGFRGLSAFGAPVRPPSGEPLRRIDSHLDPVDWRGSRSLVDPHRLAEQARTAIARGTTALGLLTHHLVFDEALWRFTASFLEMAARHPAIRLRRVADLLEPPSSECRMPPLREKQPLAEPEFAL